MSSLTRMLMVLDAFAARRTVLTAEDLMVIFGFTRGMAYRYVRELVAAGLLTRVQGQGYTLGPRIIELDRAIREYDPILSVGRPVMEALRERFQCDVLLSAFYNDKVLVTHHERGDDKITVSYGRGRIMPPFQGAPSKAILAALPTNWQRKLYRQHADLIESVGLGESWNDFKNRLAEIKRDGYCVSFAELDAGNVGIAVPLLNQALLLPGSLALVVAQKQYDILDKAYLKDTLIQAARQIDALANETIENAAPFNDTTTKEHQYGGTES